MCVVEGTDRRGGRKNCNLHIKTKNKQKDLSLTLKGSDEVSVVLTTFLTSNLKNIKDLEAE